jgi:hypothetical protein
VGDMPEFKPFQSIPRLKRNIVITEKIDGTNGIVHISDDGQTVTAGSRNRWVTPEHDNYGFGAWVAANAEELKRLGPGYHYGEWWGAGIQRRYGLSEKRFSLFNTSRWTDDTVTPACCSLVPVLYNGPYDNGAIEQVCENLRNLGSVAAPGFMDPEGIVVFHCASRTLAKFTLDGDGHKGGRKNG